MTSSALARDFPSDLPGRGLIRDRALTIGTKPGRAAAFTGTHVLSMAQYSRADLETLFAAAEEIRLRFSRQRAGQVLAGRVLVSAFFERSTRTRLAHETAMLRLGGTVTGFAEPTKTRACGQAGESHDDVARMMSLYGDVVVVRHPETGWPRHAADRSAGALFINGGDGLGEHPTQSMVDLYTIWRRLGKLDGLRVLLVNDLRMRCVRSLLLGLRHFGCEVHGVSARGLPIEVPAIPGMAPVRLHDSVERCLREVDVVYSSPTIAAAPDGAGEEAQRLRTVALHRNVLESANNRRLIVLHPLPRGIELAEDVDDTPFNAYWEQAKNGVMVRMALLRLMLGC